MSLMADTHRRGKLLLIAPFPYGSLSGQGGATACMNALRLLSEVHDLGIVVFNSGSQADQLSVQEMKAQARDIWEVPFAVSKPLVLKAKLKSLLTATPEHAVYFDRPAMRQAIDQAMASFKPDWVMTQFPQMAQYLPCAAPTPSVADVQDAYSVSWFRRATSAPAGLKRLYAYKQWLNWVQYERRHYAQANAVWTLSDQDAWGLKAFNPSLPTQAVGLPMSAPPSALAGRRDEPSATPTLGFIASFGHPPNIEALAYLLKHIVPAVTRQAPQARFVIAGRNPPPHLVKSAPANVIFKGYVDDLAAFYQSCDIIVAPLLSGGGLKIKVAEALGHGKAIVATPVAVEGMGLVHARDVLVGETSDTLTQAIVRLLGDAPLRQRLEQGAKTFFNGQFDKGAWLGRAQDALARLDRRSTSQIFRP